MRARYLRAVLRQDVEYFDLTVGSTSQVVTGVSGDTLFVQDALSEKVPNFVMNVAMFVASYAVALALLWRLTLVSLLIVPGFLYGRAQAGLARRMREQYARPGAIAEQAMSSVRTVYSFAVERATVARFSAALEESVRLGLRQGLAKGLAVGSGGIRIAIFAFNVWYGSRLVMYHGYKGGTVYIVSVIIVVGGGALGSALSNIKYLTEASSAAERIMELIRRVAKIDSESGAGEVLENVAGEVEFRNVAFCYPSRPKSPVFVNLSLHVPAGRSVALVGASGSGKSTVIALLERFYDPSAGEVTLDGVDIRRLQLKWLRAQMGLVSQEPALFATSIRENIKFGKEDATEEEVTAAAKAANAHGFISQLPRGYDTQVGERGIQMSGGQKQRIAIARAILKSPKILLLDEATSALDSNSERAVQEALESVSVDRTTIMVAHRLSTIRNADMIVVMQSGEVKELGTHYELNAQENGIYSSLVRLQQTTDVGMTEEAGKTGSTDILRQSDSQSITRNFSVASRSSSSRLIGDAKYDGNLRDLKPPVPSFGRLLMLNAPELKQASAGIFSAIVSGGIQPVFAYAMGSVTSIFFSTDHQEIKKETRTYTLISAGLAMLTFLIKIYYLCPIQFMQNFLPFMQNSTAGVASWAAKAKGSAPHRPRPAASRRAILSPAPGAPGSGQTHTHRPRPTLQRWAATPTPTARAGSGTSCARRAPARSRSPCGTPCRRTARRRCSRTPMMPARLLPSDDGTMAPRHHPLPACGGSPCGRRAPGTTRTPCRRGGTGSGAGARPPMRPPRTMMAPPRRVADAAAPSRRLAGTRRRAP
ncbi:putative multidrug resistance protein isoform X2 [Panicum virgatum]|nr:putative multidrug resistance protein isoform X2 [Panicum virgatum]KAG2646569.1 hypothetical protein PVAP13_2KG517105 [Panicum virgatum]